ncbi:MAG: MBL fold metallo-hydrolase [Desulfuromonadales bacterium]|nr:MBL fold metallo-hydrolase [Desulfuromonadales bacterium]
MRLRQPGKVHDRLWFLGHEGSCVYLLEGSRGSLLISGGINAIVPDILEQFSRFGIDENRIRGLLVLHSHFDHVGIVPFFKRRHPGMTVYAAARALDIFQKPKAIAAINDASRYILKNQGVEHLSADYDLEWRVGMAGEAVGEGAQIDLGDLEVRIIEIPGHSPCSIAAYVPELKALFPSDGGGIPFRDGINVYGTSDYSRFQESLQKLKYLEVDYLCADHHGYVTGEEAGAFIARAIDLAAQKRERMEEAYRRHGSVELAAEELAHQFGADNADNIVPPEVFVESYRQMIMHIAGLKLAAVPR